MQKQGGQAVVEGVHPKALTRGQRIDDNTADESHPKSSGQGFLVIDDNQKRREEHQAKTRPQQRSA